MLSQIWEILSSVSLPSTLGSHTFNFAFVPYIFCRPSVVASAYYHQKLRWLIMLVFKTYYCLTDNVYVVCKLINFSLISLNKKRHQSFLVFFLEKARNTKYYCIRQKISVYECIKFMAKLNWSFFYCVVFSKCLQKQVSLTPH